MSDTVRAWRIVKRRHIAAAFTGEGARIHGGRWTPPGIAAVYASQSLSLALLEVLVNLDAPARIPRYVCFTFDIPRGHIRAIDPAEFPDIWRLSPATGFVQAIGKRWAVSGESLALRVPSAVLPVEFNYVLNPAHAGFSNVVVGGPFDLNENERVWGG